MNYKILFIDLDNTIIETKSGNTFPQDANDWKFKKNALYRMCQALDEYDFIVIITNQAGIEEGYIKPLELRAKIDDVIANIYEAYSMETCNHSDKAEILNIIAPFKESQLRKPQTKGAEEYLKEYVIGNFGYEEIFGTDEWKKHSMMVGDASGLARKTWLDEEETEIVWENVEHEHTEVADPKFYKGVRLVKVPKESGQWGDVFFDYKELKWYTNVQDFSDSDKRFAENMGIKYIDVEEFLS